MCTVFKSYGWVENMFAPENDFELIRDVGLQRACKTLGTIRKNDDFKSVDKFITRFSY